MENNIFLFAKSGGLFGVMFALFFIGFAMKVVLCLIYDSAIEKAILFQGSDKSWVWRTIEKYNNMFNDEKKCKNTVAYVDNELHNWKVCGIMVERFDDISNIISGLAIFICVIFDMIILLSESINSSDFYEYIKYICFYTLMSVIMMIVIKGWDMFINISNKRNVLRDKLVNYLDNNYGAEEYLMVNTNIYIDNGNENIENGVFSQVENELKNNIQSNQKNNFHNDLSNNIQSNTQNNIKEARDKKFENSRVSDFDNGIKEYIENKSKDDIVEENKGSMKKNDKEKVIEQVLEEFLV